ncbi:hypothetical protein ACFL1M_04925 [Patescibacteria group bacterium]
MTERVSAIQSYLRHGTEGPPQNSGGGAFSQYMTHGTEHAPPPSEAKPTDTGSPIDGLSMDDFRVSRQLSLRQVEHEENVTNALLRVAAASLLNKPLPRFGVSAADIAQEKVIQTTEKALNKVGDISTRLQIPTEKNVAQTVKKLENAYKRAMPLGDGQPVSLQRLDKDIHNGAYRLYSRAWELKPPTRKNDLTPDEYALAEQIWQLRKDLTPTQLKQLMFEAIFDRSMDITARQSESRLGHKQQHMLKNLEQLANIPPEHWFVVDWVTSEVMLTPEEQKRLEDSVWAVTAKNIALRQIGETDMTTLPIHMLSTAKSPGDVIMFADKPDYINLLQKKLGRFYPYVDKFLVQKLGGTVQFTPKGRETPFGEIAVRDPQGTIDQIAKLAGLARSANSSFDLMTRVVRAQNAPPKRQIRPKAITNLLGREVFTTNHPESPHYYRYVKEAEDLAKRRDLALDALASAIGNRPPNTKIDDLPPATAAVVNHQRQLIDHINKRGARIHKNLTGRYPWEKDPNQK